MPEDPQDVATRDLVAAVRELAAIASGERSDPDRRPTDPPPGTCDWGDCTAYAADWRWSDEGGGWLPVCADHGTAAASDADPEPVEVFASVRDYAVACARSVAMLEPTLIQQAIDEADRALALGPILDPTLWQRGQAELEQQTRLLRALLHFRLRLEEFRPAAGA